MSCCASREKLEDVSKEQQWDWLNLSDFKSSSCLTPLSYGILYISLAISVACYCVDAFTAVNLLGKLDIYDYGALVATDKKQYEISGLGSSNRRFHSVYPDGYLQAA
ncbi:hypothetical protein MMC13_006425 [Lambiella insularis]|nr:hypothetical protein [Lambiella insularis]